MTPSIPESTFAEWIMPWLEGQLPYIEAIQAFALPLKPIASYLNHLDSTPFVLLVLLLVWLITRANLAFRATHWLLLSGLLNTSLKAFFQEPRPFLIDRDLTWIDVGGWSFPSGAAQSSLLYVAMAFLLSRDLRIRAATLLFALLLSSSRVLLAVHYPTDILAGWLVGFFIVALSYSILPQLEIGSTDLNGSSDTKRVLYKKEQWIPYLVALLFLSYFLSGSMQQALLGYVTTMVFLISALLFFYQSKQPRSIHLSERFGQNLGIDSKRESYLWILASLLLTFLPLSHFTDLSAVTLSAMMPPAAEVANPTGPSMLMRLLLVWLFVSLNFLLQNNSLPKRFTR